MESQYPVAIAFSVIILTIGLGTSKCRRFLTTWLSRLRLILTQRVSAVLRSEDCGSRSATVQALFIYPGERAASVIVEWQSVLFKYYSHGSAFNEMKDRLSLISA